MSYGHADASEVGIANILHASGNKEESILEIKHWFNENELFHYDTVHEKFTQAKK